MGLLKDNSLWQRKHYTPIVLTILVVVVLLALFTDVFRSSEIGSFSQFIRLLVTMVLLIAVIVMLSKIAKILEALEKNGAGLEKIAEALEKNRAVLVQISQNTHLSETAKTITSREADMQSLREAVFDKLQQPDFDATYEIIDEISNSPYHELAEELRIDADRYRSASDQERTNQVIAHIEKLLEEHQWAKASIQIERLIKSEPSSEKAKAMRQNLVGKKEDRKKALLTAWDDAVKRQSTDRGLEILRELDSYLTPNEGLALQEAARDVFRTKLHNLGVQFSLAVSGQQWSKALEIGQQIIQDFPNSRMAEEIREKIDVLKLKSEQ